jgi:hypothetical protein
MADIVGFIIVKASIPVGQIAFPDSSFGENSQAMLGRVRIFLAPAKF